MSGSQWFVLAFLLMLILVIGGTLLFPWRIGRNDGRCGEDAKVSRARQSCVRSAWFDI